MPVRRWVDSRQAVFEPRMRQICLTLLRDIEDPGLDVLERLSITLSIVSRYCRYRDRNVR